MISTRGVAGKYHTPETVPDVDRGPRLLAKLCQMCTDNFGFWLLVGILTLSEPVLCSMYPRGLILNIQISVLSVSSLLYVIQLIGVASKEWEKIHAMQLSMNDGIVPIVSMKDMKVLKLFLFFTAEEEYTFEFGCLLWGWVFIFRYPGIAVLRCFRVYRLLWFYEVKVFKSTSLYYLNPILGKNFVTRVFSVLKFAIKAITALIDEMVRIGHRTRGGIILIMMLFYTAFVMGIVLWIETRAVNESCRSIGDCTYTLMRLTFYDGVGFDFAFFLTNDHRFLFCIVMFYMALTSFGILNGLVGIFGNVFANASEDAFGEKEEDDIDMDFEDAESDDFGFNDNNEESAKPNTGTYDAIAVSSERGSQPQALRTVTDLKASQIKEEGEDDDTSSKKDDDFVHEYDSDQISFSYPKRQVVPLPPQSVPDSPSVQSGPSSTVKPKPTIATADRKATYNDLIFLRATMRQQTKTKKLSSNPKIQKVPFQGTPVTTGGDQSAPTLMRQGSLFMAGANRKANNISQAEGGNSANDYGEELRMLRADMKAMMQMQILLQQQLHAALHQGGPDDHSRAGNSSVGVASVKLVDSPSGLTFIAQRGSPAGSDQHSASNVPFSMRPYTP